LQGVLILTKLADYQRAYPTIKLERTADGILEMTLHNNGGPYVWDFHGTIKDKTRQSSGGAQRELADALEAIARDPENKIVILTGTGDQFSGPSATKESFPRGDPEYWEVLRATDHRLVMGLLDIPVPVISCINGPAYRHAEIPFFADIVLAAEGALIQDSAHFPNRTVPGDSVNLIFPFLMGWIRGRYFLYNRPEDGCQGNEGARPRQRGAAPRKASTASARACRANGPEQSARAALHAPDPHRAAQGVHRAVPPVYVRDGSPRGRARVDREWSGSRGTNPRIPPSSARRTRPCSNPWLLARDRDRS
jgi:hypothetical protein